jgi:hypothetical protein
VSDYKDEILTFSTLVAVLVGTALSLISEFRWAVVAWACAFLLSQARIIWMRRFIQTWAQEAKTWLHDRESVKP